MGQESTNLTLIENAYALWNSEGEDNFAHWMSLMDDNVHWRSLAGGVTGMEFTADCDCKNDVVGYFTRLAQDWKMLHYTADHYIAQGDWVVMRGRCGWRNRRTGKEVQTPKADFLRLKDGKIVEFHEFYDTAAALAGTQ